MIRKTVTLISIAILAVGLIVGGVISCTPSVEEVDVGDVGKEYGLVPGQRYHKIHNVALGLECEAHHIGKLDTAQTVFSSQDVSPNAPGAVDRKDCLDCHSGSGPGKDLYNSASH